MKSVFYAGAGIQSVLFFLNDGYLSATLACGSGVSPRTVRWGGTLLPQAVGRAMEWPATATTAASGGNKELLLGQRPARCECRPRHEADAGSRNPYRMPEGPHCQYNTSSDPIQQKAPRYCEYRGLFV